MYGHTYMHYAHTRGIYRKLPNNDR